jgi:hypothetical protein
MGLLISETYVNRTEGYNNGDSGVYESRYETLGELYKGLRAMYGRCTGRVYIDKKDGIAQAIGWVFVKRMKYEDTGGPYLQETWVSVHEKMPETVTTNFYAEVK